MNIKKTILAIVVIVILIIIAIIASLARPGYQSDIESVSSQNSLSVNNLSFYIKGELFTLKDGKAKSEIHYGPGILNTLQIFGEPVYGDLDKDGDQDAAILLVHDEGAAGKSYYAALAIKNGVTFQSTETMFLDQDIAPQTVEIHDGRAVFNYAERKAGESSSVQPSIGKSVWVHYDQKTGQIGEWVKDFEGESNLPPVLQ